MICDVPSVVQWLFPPHVWVHKTPDLRPLQMLFQSGATWPLATFPSRARIAEGIQTALAVSFTPWTRGQCPSYTYHE